MVKKLRLREWSREREDAESGSWDVMLWPAYLDNEYTCACCGRRFPEARGDVYLGGYTPDGMHFIYEYTKENSVGNGVNYDPYNLPPQDDVGGIFKVVLYNEMDDEGYYWRNFCQRCWPKLTKYSPEKLASMYEPIDFI
jgi:hypothetical protein